MENSSWEEKLVEYRKSQSAKYKTHQRRTSGSMRNPIERVRSQTQITAEQVNSGESLSPRGPQTSGSTSNPNSPRNMVLSPRVRSTSAPVLPEASLLLNNRNDVMIESIHAAKNEKINKIKKQIAELDQFKDDIISSSGTSEYAVARVREIDWKISELQRQQRFMLF